MSVKPEPAVVHHDTFELYPLPPLWRNVEEKIDEAEDAGMAPEAFQEELDRIFGPDNNVGSEQIDGLLRWMIDTEQAAENEAALAEPFEEEARRHIARAHSLKGRVEWIRRRLAWIVKANGGRFSGIRRVSVNASRPSAIVAGYCSNPAHQADLPPEEIAEEIPLHWERDGCVGFRPANTIPSEFIRVEVSINRVEIAKAHRALKEQGDEVDMDSATIKRLLSFTRMESKGLSVTIR